MRDTYAKRVKAIAPASVDRYAKLPRADGNAPVERKCLVCQTVFPSEGWHNRMCHRCAKRS